MVTLPIGVHLRYALERVISIFIDHSKEMTVQVHRMMHHR
jgi:hypothetical protein